MLGDNTWLWLVICMFLDRDLHPCWQFRGTEQHQRRLCLDDGFALFRVGDESQTIGRSGWR